MKQAKDVVVIENGQPPPAPLVGEITYVETPRPLSLVSKLAKVMGAVERVAKNGINKFHNYNYATEADITQAVRSEMAAQNLILVPNIEKVEWQDVLTSANKKERLCTLTVLFTVMDGDSEATLKFNIIGQGQDGGDKASYKAMTGATKYALLKLFLIPTGDDPENEKAEKGAVPVPQGVAGLKEALNAVHAPKHFENHAPANVGGPDDISLPLGTPDDGPCPPYGKNKGKKWSELSVSDLEFYMGGSQKSLADPSKESYHERERRNLATAQRWIQFRS